MNGDRERLRDALTAIGVPCPFCDASTAYVAWDLSARRPVVKVVHPTGSCPALAPGPFQDRACSFLTSLLELHGIRAAEYCDGDLVSWHDWR